MKKLTKLIAVLIVAILAAALAVPAFAVSASTGSVTVNKAVLGETLSFYRIFDFVDGADVETYVVADAFRPFFTKAKVGGTHETVTDQEILAYLANINDNSAAAQTLARELGAFVTANGIAAEKTVTVENAANTTVSGLPYGYYLMVPQLPARPDGQESADAIIFSLGKVNGASVSITNKLSVPTPDKFVSDNDEAYVVTEGGEDYERKGNVIAVGQTYEYTILGNVPNMDEYARYRFQIRDTMHNIELVPGSIVLSIGGVTVPITYDNANAEDDPAVNVYASIGTYALASGAAAEAALNDGYDGDGQQSFTIHIKDMKKIASATYGAEIKLVYNAKLTKDAIIGSTGNLNEVDFRYSNNPADGGVGMGDSPKSKTRTFTLDIQVNKEDSAEDALKGSTWSLKKGAELIATIDGADLSTFDWGGLDVGTYTLTEDEAPDGYTKMDGDITIVITAETSLKNDGDETYSLTAYNATVTGPNGYISSTQDAGYATLSTGIVALDVANFRPDELPGTGGMGLYVIAVAAALALAAFGSIMIVKKKVTV